MKTYIDHRGGLCVGTAVLALAIAGSLGGCVSHDDNLMSPAQRPKVERTLTVSEFYNSSAKAEHPAPLVKPEVAAASDNSTSGGVEAPVNATSVPAVAGDKVALPAVVSHAGLVGQVNGRPIYVSEFFAPIENQLRIWGTEKSRRDFISEAYPLIKRQLAELVKNELVYAEAEASLTENERVGLRNLLQQLEGDVTRTRGRVAQNERMRAETGLGVDEVLELERRRQLVMFKIQSAIRKRVIISWRDVQRYYRDHQAEFNPPASIQLRLLSAKADDPARCKQIEQSLADGYLFSTLAEEHTTILASRGGLMEPVLLNKGIQGTALTAWPEVDKLVRTLKKGEYGGPVTVGDLSIWVYIENLDDGSGRSLYEVQHEIENRLFQERYREEEQKFLAELFARGNMDDFDNMSILLLDIAMQRWAAPE